MWRSLRKLANNKEFLQGGRFQLARFNFPFKQDFKLLTAMFEVRKWFVLNTPDKFYAENYTNQMAHLHNELNYQHARLMLRRILGVEAHDWKDTFDLKFNEKVYGTLVSASGEGLAAMDD